MTPDLDRIERRAEERDGSAWSEYERLSYRCVNLASRLAQLEVENRRLRVVVRDQQRLLDMAETRWSTR